MQKRRETRLGRVEAPAIYLRCLNALLFPSSFIFVFLPLTRDLLFSLFRLMLDRSNRGGVGVVGCSADLFS